MTLSQEQIKKIKEIAVQVQAEYQMGGLAKGLYFDFAKDVAERYANHLLEEQKREIREEINLMQGYITKIPAIDPSLGELCDADVDFVGHIDGQVIFKKDVLSLPSLSLSTNQSNK